MSETILKVAAEAAAVVVVCFVFKLIQVFLLRQRKGSSVVFGGGVFSQLNIKSLLRTTVSTFIHFG